MSVCASVRMCVRLVRCQREQVYVSGSVLSACVRICTWVCAHRHQRMSVIGCVCVRVNESVHACVRVRLVCGRACGSVGARECCVFERVHSCVHV